MTIQSWLVLIPRSWPARQGQDIFADEDASRNFKVTEAEGWHANPDGEPITGLHVSAHLDNPKGLFALPHGEIENRLS